MNQYKHICNLEYCKRNSTCIFKNAESVLKSDAYEVELGNKVNSDIILCYQKEDIGLEPKIESEIVKPVKKKAVIKRIEDSDNSWDVYLALNKDKSKLCENPKCKLGNPVSEIRHNDEINLCKHCNDLLHLWKTNHELARYFNSKTKIIKLLSFIRELEKENNENKEVIRCTNIYCATTENMTQHHLFPKGYREGIVGRIGRVYLCRPCHDRVHELKGNGELAEHYSTKQGIINLLALDRKHRVKRFLYTYVNTEVAQRAVA